MNKPKVGQGYRFTTIVLSSIMLLLSGAYLYMVWAVESKAWDFATASDYTVYKGDGSEDASNSDIIVEDGVAKLVSRTTQINDDTQAEYDTGAYSSTAPQGQDVSLHLTKTGSTYNTAGTFTSRVFNGGAGNTWVKLSASLQSRLNMTGLNWTKVPGNSPNYNAVIYWIYTGWSDDGPITPCVIKDGTGYKAYWTDSIYRVNTRLGGPATSDDGITFTKVQDSCLGLGAAGKFDNTYIQTPCVIKDDSESDPSKRYKMWYGGYATIGVGAWRIGYATSADGITWTRQTGPNTGGSVIDIGVSGDPDSTGVMHPWVIKDGSTYKMWYMGTNGIGYHLIYTWSTDGVNWCDEYGASNKVLAKYSGTDPFDSHSMYWPTVIKDGSLYKMWYTGYGTGVSSSTALNNSYYRIGYAISYDGIHWATMNGPLTGGCVIDRSNSGSWFDSNYAQTPCVIKEEDGSYKMWYSGYYGSNRRIGLATGAVDSAASTAVRFQVRSGASSNLTGDFVGPDGSTSSYYIIDNALPPPHGSTYNSLYWSVNSMYVPKSAYLVEAPGKFSVSDPYVQYRVYLDGASDGSLTPTVDWVAFEGTKASRCDNTLGDFNGGTYTDVTTTFSTDGPDPYVGLAKLPNGQYSPSGTYTSAVFDGGAAADWESISWSGAGQAINPPEPGLVGLYHLDGNADDSSGRGNHGSVSGTISYDSATKKLGSACFNGNGNAYIALPASLNEFKAMTVSAWVYFNSTDASPGGHVVSSYQTPTYDTFYLSASHYYVSYSVNDLGQTSSRANTITTTPLSYDEWHHVACTWNGTPFVDSIKVYLDGKEQMNKGRDQASITFRCLRNFNTSIPIHIGHYYVASAPATHYYFKGKIDEVAIYDRALSADEIDLQYKRAADIKFQCRSGDTNPPTGSFVGPDGTASSFYATADGSNFGDEIPNGRYFQYRAYFGGIGVNTPALKGVTVSYNSASSTDDTRAEFDQGSYDSSTTQWYGDQLGLAGNPYPLPVEISS
ncbi:MAG: LamG-like jellyroll fold domain-containing protein, partial [Candidatus Omnitrophota bacterium]